MPSNGASPNGNGAHPPPSNGSATPIQTVGGQDPKTGRFMPGNRLARGNPFIRKVSALRNEMIRAVHIDDWRRIIAMMVKQALQGDPLARRELFDRLLGKSVDPTLLAALLTGQFAGSGTGPAHQIELRIDGKDITEILDLDDEPDGPRELTAGPQAPNDYAGGSG